MEFIKSIIKKIYKIIFLRTNDKRIEYYRKIGVKIGEGSIILCAESAFGSEPYLISIGNNCLISGNVNFITHDGGFWVLNNLNLEDQADKFGTVKISNNVFIGTRVIIMPGVEIGDNCVIGAGSIVTKSVDSNSVVAGVPAKKICSIYEYHDKNKHLIDKTYGLDRKLKKQYLQRKYKNIL